MCKLIVATKKPVKNKTFTDLLTAQFKDIKEQRDGLAILTINKNNKLEVTREFKSSEYDYLLWKMIRNVDNKKVVMIHSRKGTSGDTVIGNVHFFEHKGYYFAQNGFVNEYLGDYNKKTWTLYDDDEVEKNVSKAKKRVGIKRITTLTNRILEIENKTKKIDIKIGNLENVIENCQECRNSLKGYCTKHRQVFDTHICYETKIDSLDLECEQLKNRRMEIWGCKVKDKDIPKLLKAQNNFAKCDTLQFYEELKKPVSIANLKKEVVAKNHSGCSVIINKKTFETFYVAGSHGRAIYNNDFTALFSFYPNLKTTSKKEYNHKGIILEEDIDIDLDLDRHDIREGVYKFKV